MLLLNHSTNIVRDPATDHRAIHLADLRAEVELRDRRRVRHWPRLRRRKATA